MSWEGLNPPYATIVADPPWHYDDRLSVWDENGRQGTAMPYSMMSLEEIADIPVARLSGRGAHLYLWTTNQYVEAAYGIARAWGFEPSQLLTWCKPSAGLGPGGMFANTTEFVVYARCSLKEGRTVERAGSLIKTARQRAGLSRRELHQLVRGGTLTGLVEQWENNGCLPNPTDWRRLCEVLPSLAEVDRPYVPSPPAKERARVDSTWWEWPRSYHSAKPPAFLDIVEQVSPGPYVELFARAPRLGWDSWGLGYESGAA